MSLAVVTLKKGEGRLLKSGGMWVFDNEIASIMGSFVNGDIVLVHDFDGYPLGRGFINTNSKITVRLLSRDENQHIDEDFFEKRVRDAWEYRKKVTDTSSCRLIFGEADFLPGLTVDKFEDVLVVQSLALGIDRWKEMILELIRKVLAEDGINIRGIYERSDAKVRKQEGMELHKGFIGPEFPTLVEIVENGVKYQVTAIAPNAFKNNKNLKTIIIPATVRSIGKQAFAGCKNLKSIIIRTPYLTKKSVGAKAFKGISSKAVIKVPKKQLKAYKKLLKTKGVAKSVKIK